LCNVPVSFDTETIQEAYRNHTQTLEKTRYESSERVKTQFQCTKQSHTVETRQCLVSTSWVLFQHVDISLDFQPVSFPGFGDHPTKEKLAGVHQTGTDQVHFSGHVPNVDIVTPDGDGVLIVFVARVSFERKYFLLEDLRFDLLDLLAMGGSRQDDLQQEYFTRKGGYPFRLIAKKRQQSRSYRQYRFIH